MSFIDSSASRVLVNEKHVSGSIRGWDVAGGRELDDVTVILDTGHRFIPSLVAGAMSVDGLFDNAVGGLYDEITAAAGVDNGLLFTVAPNGFTVGQPALMAQAELADVKVASKVGNAVALNVQAQPDDCVDFGFILHALTAEVASSNGTGVNNGAASTNNAIANLHVTAYSGFTNIVVKVQDSADNSTFADIATFTTVTGLTSERKTITGTIRQYTRALWTVTGTGSATFVVALGRR